MNKLLDIGLSILPFAYTIKTRYQTLASFISWLLSYPFLFFLLYIFNSVEQTNSMISFSLGFIALNLIYEVGYIYNDKITTKNEKNPTIRKSFYFIENDYELVILIKLIIAYTILSFFHSFSHILVGGVLLSIFLIHNNVRGKINFITYTILFMVKIISPLLFLNVGYFVYVYLVIVVVFPRVLEHMTRKRYGFKMMNGFVGRREVFRLWIHMLLSISTCLIAYLADDHSIRELLILSFYLLFYRILGYVIKQSELLRVNKHPDYDY